MASFLYMATESQQELLGGEKGIDRRSYLVKDLILWRTSWKGKFQIDQWLGGAVNGHKQQQERMFWLYSWLLESTHGLKLIGPHTRKQPILLFVNSKPQIVKFWYLIHTLTHSLVCGFGHVMFSSLTKMSGVGLRIASSRSSSASKHWWSDGNQAKLFFTPTSSSHQTSPEAKSPLGFANPQSTQTSLF